MKKALLFTIASFCMCLAAHKLMQEDYFLINKSYSVKQDIFYPGPEVWMMGESLNNEKDQDEQQLAKE